MARLLDRRDEHGERFLVRRQVRREAALVADAAAEAAVVKDAFQGVVRLDPPPQALAEGGRAVGDDHELLEVDVVVGVHAAVQHVHHRDGEHVGVDPAEVAVQRQVELVSGGPGDGERHAEDGVRAEPRLRRRPVEVDEREVDQPLVGGVEPLEHLGDLVAHVADRAEHALAAVAGVPVA